MSRLLLDTCAVIWWFQGDDLEPRAKRAIAAADEAGTMLISPASAWEIGLLSRQRGAKPAKMTFTPSAKAFVDRVFADPGVEIAPFTPEITFESCCLPGAYHHDPADRFLIATARLMGVPIVTRDEHIEAYAKAGHVKLIVC